MFTLAISVLLTIYLIKIVLDSNRPFKHHLIIRLVAIFLLKYNYHKWLVFKWANPYIFFLIFVFSTFISK